MKYIIILLLSVNTFANYKIEINSNEAQGMLECSNQADCDAKLLKFTKQTKLQGVWNEEPLGSIVSETYIDNLTNEENTRYFHPINFTINQVDLSAEIQAEQDKQNRIEELKNKPNKTLPELIELLEKKGLI